MKLLWAFLVVCALEVNGFPYYYGANNFDALSYGASDYGRGGLVMNRYYNPYYRPRAVGMSAVMFRPEQYQSPSSQYYAPSRKPTEDEYVPLQNEVYPQEQIPEQPGYAVQPVQPIPPATEATELADPTQKVEVQTTTLKTLVTPEIVEPETEEVQKPVVTLKKRVTKTKPVKNPEEVGEEEGNGYYPAMPESSYFPMYFSYGRRGGGAPGGPGGATAIANAFSTGRGGVASSHATAYGPPAQQPDYRSSA